MLYMKPSYITIWLSCSTPKAKFLYFLFKIGALLGLDVLKPAGTRVYDIHLLNHYFIS